MKGFLLLKILITFLGFSANMKPDTIQWGMCYEIKKINRRKHFCYRCTDFNMQLFNSLANQYRKLTINVKNGNSEPRTSNLVWKEYKKYEQR